MVEKVVLEYACGSGELVAALRPAAATLTALQIIDSPWDVRNLYNFDNYVVHDRMSALP
jgi:hypothetical protein